MDAVEILFRQKWLSPLRKIGPYGYVSVAHKLRAFLEMLKSVFTIASQCSGWGVSDDCSKV